MVKTQKPTDDLLMLLNESELVFIAEVPARRYKGSRDNIMFPLLYSWVANEILSRLHKCFLLFNWKLSRLSWEFDLRPDNSGRLYATASFVSSALANAVISKGISR